ncbi:hypothetical protein AOLI_G00245120 [Acnodon oligacanthus]
MNSEGTSTPELTSFAPLKCNQHETERPKTVASAADAHAQQAGAASAVPHYRKRQEVWQLLLFRLKQIRLLDRSSTNKLTLPNVLRHKQAPDSQRHRADPV